MNPAPNGYLLDTHVLLWWLGTPDRLTREAREAIRQRELPVFVSAASGWEMGIKRGLGRLDVPGELASTLREQQIEELPVSFAHGLAVAALPIITATRSTASSWCRPMPPGSRS